MSNICASVTNYEGSKFLKVEELRCAFQYQLNQQFPTTSQVLFVGFLNYTSFFFLYKHLELFTTIKENIKHIHEINAIKIRTVLFAKPCHCPS